MTANAYEKDYTVGFADLDCSGFLSPAALQTFLQDAGTIHSERLGFSREALMDRLNAFWMLIRLWYRLDRPIAHNETLTLHTWHREAAGAIFYRDFDLLVDGKPVGEAVSAWVVYGTDIQRPLRPSALRVMGEFPAPPAPKAITLGKLAHPNELRQGYTHTVRYSDLDINGHVNNVRYVDMALNALEMERREGVFVSEWRIHYLHQARAGESLEMSHGELSKDAEYFARGTGADGTDRFEAALTLSPV